MILVDVNLLVYATFETLPQHPQASSWLEERLSGTVRVGLPWPSLLGFLRLASNPRMFERPLPLADAWEVVTDWLSCDCVWVLQPSTSHARILGELMALAGRSNLVPDAHLAALAIEHGLTLCSTDADFARFPGLRWENPLLG